MIQLTRLNGIPIVLNSDLIKTAEASPDTMLTLINGEKIIVREDCEKIMERVIAYRAGCWPPSRDDCRLWRSRASRLTSQPRCL